jgi:hypothetical protein
MVRHSGDTIKCTVHGSKLGAPSFELAAAIGKQTLPCLIIFVMALAMLIHGPIAQLADYHHFADSRAWLGIPNAADVLSNLGFAVVGLVGLGALRRFSTKPSLVAGRHGYTLFFVGLVLTACGSAWYHLAPDNARLVYDRLPIALACAGLMAAVWEETIGESRWLATMLAIFGALCVFWWRYTDVTGIGDLRPYLLLQVLPLLLIPVLQWQHKAATRDRLAFAIMITLYVAAKGFELADHATFGSFEVLSGHTLKHLLATLAAATVLWSVIDRAQRS